MTTTKQTVAGQVGAFLSAAREHGFTVSIASENVVRISKRFAAGDHDAFTTCDMFGGNVLALAPLRDGSVWGTDGGSVGGMCAINHGLYTLNKSGTAKRFMRLLAAHLETAARFNIPQHNHGTRGERFSAVCNACEMLSDNDEGQ